MIIVGYIVKEVCEQSGLQHCERHDPQYEHKAKKPACTHFFSTAMQQVKRQQRHYKRIE